MKGQGARLTVLITDTCASGEAGPLVEAPVIARKTEACRYLFFRHAGVVDINSATPPQSAYGDKKYGGAFTSAFQQLLAAPNEKILLGRTGETVVTWDAFFEKVTERTETNFQMFKKANPGVDQEKQTPKAWELAKPVPNAKIEFAQLWVGIDLVDTPDRSGARIARVYEGSPAEWYGLRTNDVLTKVEQIDEGQFAARAQNKVVQTWQVTDATTIAARIHKLQFPTLLRCTLRDSTTGKERTLYLRTLGLRAP
jgi:hypothetical protein